MTTNRSSEELMMRALIVPELRKQYPNARIIHELPLRYSTNRIDLAAVTPDKIISVEIKSSKDVADRLEAQLRGFLPVSSRVIAALAPRWNVKLPTETRHWTDKDGRKVISHQQPLTAAPQIIRRVGCHSETWTVDAEALTIDVTDRCYRDGLPSTAAMLDMLHVSELVTIASRYGCWSGKRPVHLDLVNACFDLMTGREVRAAVCRALRERNAFAAGSDLPVLEAA